MVGKGCKSLGFGSLGIKSSGSTFICNKKQEQFFFFVVVFVFVYLLSFLKFLCWFVFMNFLWQKSQGTYDLQVHVTEIFDPITTG